MSFCFFFFNAPSTTDIYTLSLHDALPISGIGLKLPETLLVEGLGGYTGVRRRMELKGIDRKSTRLNSSHVRTSYAVFCLKKKIYWKCKYIHNTYNLFHQFPIQYYTVCTY